MASPIRDQVTYHHTPATGSQSGGPGSLQTPDVALSPIKPATQNGRLLKAFYDDVTEKTYSLTVTRGASKKYLALPESAWRDMLPDLRNMHPQECPKSIIDLSTRWIVALDSEIGAPLNTHQIDPDEDSERFSALTSVRDYLVQNRYAEAPNETITDGYDLRDEARLTFAAREARPLPLQRLNMSVVEMARRKKEFRNWTQGEAGDNPDTRMGYLPAALDAARDELEAKKQDIENNLRGIGPCHIKQLEALNSDLRATKEHLSALEHTREISWASALLGHSYDPAEQSDWRAPLRMAFDAKTILLEFFKEKAEQPISTDDMKVLEKRSTDIAALLIPPTIGKGTEMQSGEALLRLFYAGGETLSDLVRREARAPVEDEDAIVPANPPTGIDIPIFSRVELPKESGHKYLREMLAQFHADQSRPIPQPANQAIFDS